MANGNGSVLSRIGTGALAFGAGTTASNIENIRTQRDINKNELEIQEREMQAEQDATLKQQRLEQLQSTAFGGGPESEAAMLQLAIEAPDQFEQINQSTGLISQGQRDDAAAFSLDLLNTPFDQRQAKINQRITEVASSTDQFGKLRDPQHTASLQGLPEEEQNQLLMAQAVAALPVAERIARRDKLTGVDADIPVKVQEREALLTDADLPIDGTPDEQVRRSSARIALGLDPRSVGSAAQTIAKGGEEVAEDIAETQAIIEEGRKFGQLTGSSRAKAIDDGVEQVLKIEKNIRNLDDAVTALEGGAQTGAVISRFAPTVRAQTVALEQVQGRLALDVIGAVTFGALSQGELDLAKEVALPTNLSPPELIKWIKDRQAAQGKLRDYFNEQIQFLDQGGTVAGFKREKARRGDQAAPAETTGGETGDRERTFNIQTGEFEG